MHKVYLLFKSTLLTNNYSNYFITLHYAHWIIYIKCAQLTINYWNRRTSERPGGFFSKKHKPRVDFAGLIFSTEVWRKLRKRPIGKSYGMYQLRSKSNGDCRESRIQPPFGYVRVRPRQMRTKLGWLPTASVFLTNVKNCFSKWQFVSDRTDRETGSKPATACR